ncbi:hypothetical protein ACFY2T_33285 [Streptomyces sp. NPDC001260]|uniref:hypothetical protein n=1 Tax=Streptomyces sp. NPDC001260 TaxID=3364551 RepID=UPI0036B69CD8
MNSPERFHLIHSAGGRPVAHGWWSDEAVARSKFVLWVGQNGSVVGTRIALDDEAEARTLAVWPDPE